MGGFFWRVSTRRVWAPRTLIVWVGHRVGVHHPYGCPIPRVSGWAEYTYMTHYEIRDSEPEQIPDHISPESVGGPSRLPEPVDLESMTPEEATVAAFEHGDLIESTY